MRLDVSPSGPALALSNADNLSITADGKQLALLRANAQADVYVAELEAGGKSMKNPRRLTLDETDDAVWDWTADSRAVLFDVEPEWKLGHLQTRH